MSFLQVAVMAVVTKLGIVGPVAPHRPHGFDVPGKLEKEFAYPFRERLLLLPGLSGKGDRPWHGRRIYPGQGYFKGEFVRTTKLSQYVVGEEDNWYLP
jgi:hypothetical protein